MKPPVNLQIQWAGERRFDAGRPGRPTIQIDSAGKTGPSPVETLVAALGACSAVDVVDILEKRRTPPSALVVDATGERADGVPARLTRVMMTWRIDGDGIDRANAERAIELAITKYCSVRDSLDRSIPIEYSLTLNGEPGSVRPA